jgi:hypothetical protein
LSDPSPIFTIDRSLFAEKFPAKPFAVRHSLAGHPLFELERLVELSRRLPASDVESNAGSVAVNQDPTATPATGLSIDETIIRIRECGAWLVLKLVEQDPEYRALLDRCLDEIAGYSKLSTTMKREAFIFVSSPRSVTPYHIDPEHNFLLQIHGRKTVNIFDPTDPELVSDQQIEGLFLGAHRNIEYRPSMQQKAWTYSMGPGEAAHFPVVAPHWIQNEDEVSVSFSITFRSELSERMTRVHQLNARLRKLGLAPARVGAHPAMDSVKDVVYRAVRKVGGLVGAGEEETRRAYTS